MAYYKGGMSLLPFDEKNTDTKQLFIDYLHTSNISYLTSGFNGFTLLLSLVPQIPDGQFPWKYIFNTTMNKKYYYNEETNKVSNEIPPEIMERLSDFFPNYYKQIRPDEQLGSPVTKLLIKLCMIHDYTTPFKVTNVLNHTLASDDEESFHNEINIQTDIYFKSIKYLQPICPGIVYSNIISDKNDISEFIELLKQNSAVNLHQPLTRINQALNYYTGSKLGVIVMEMVQQAQTLSNIVENPKLEKLKNTYESICRYALINLTMQTGYNHGDFHGKNFLLANSKNYFYMFETRPIIIDFGRASKIPPDMMNKMKQLFKERKFTDILSALCDFSSSNEIVSDIRYTSHFGWVCGDYNMGMDIYSRYIEDVAEYEEKDKSEIELKYPKPQPLPEIVNAQINNIYVKRNEMITHNIQVMNELHDKNPDKYPLLPVSNQIKNKLYSGLLGGYKMKKNRKYKKHRKNSNKNRSRRKSYRKKRKYSRKY